MVIKMVKQKKNRPLASVLPKSHKGEIIHVPVRSGDDADGRSVSSASAISAITSDSEHYRRRYGSHATRTHNAIRNDYMNEATAIGINVPIPERQNVAGSRLVGSPNTTSRSRPANVLPSVAEQDSNPNNDGLRGSGRGFSSDSIGRSNSNRNSDSGSGRDLISGSRSNNNRNRNFPSNRSNNVVTDANAMVTVGISSGQKSRPMVTDLGYEDDDTRRTVTSKKFSSFESMRDFIIDVRSKVRRQWSLVTEMPSTSKFLVCVLFFIAILAVIMGVAMSNKKTSGNSSPLNNLANDDSLREVDSPTLNSIRETAPTLRPTTSFVELPTSTFAPPERENSANTGVCSSPLIRLDGANVQADDEYGKSVAIGTSGRTVTVVVGAALGDSFESRGAGWNTGSASVYRMKADGTWEQIKQLYASDGEEDASFGASIAISSDDTIVVGSPLKNVGLNGVDENNGKTYIYTPSGSDAGNWEETFLLPSDGGRDIKFGQSVDIMGRFIVVGSPGEQRIRIGSAYVFIRRAVGGAWQQRAKLFASDGDDGSLFGRSVAIFSNNRGSDCTVVVGAPLGDARAENSGSAYVYSMTEDGAWRELAKLQASDGRVRDEFGFSLDIHDVSGQTIVVGAPMDDGAYGFNSGSVYVFNMSESGSWEEVAKLTAPFGGENDRFGASVAMSGTKIIVGAPGRSAVYVYKIIDGRWALTQLLQDQDRDTTFGSSVDTSQELGWLVVGDPSENEAFVAEECQT